MANDVVFKDNSAAVLAQFSKNVGKCLNVIGLEFVRLSQQEADRLIYDTPLPNRWAKRTGDYRRNLMYSVDIGDKTVYVGVDQSIFYALFLELGTWKMKTARPVIRNAVQNNFDVWREIIFDIMGEGF